LRECFQESLLHGFFRLAAVAKKSVRNVENSGAVSANDFSEGRFICRAYETRQFEIRRLIVTVRQKRSSDRLCQNRERTGVPARATRVGWWMRPDRCAPATENHN